MTKGKKLRSALVASGLSLCLCVGMLAGSTYAWFTDSVTSTGNVITAGSLDVNAYYYDYATSGNSVKTIQGTSGAYTLALDDSLTASDYSNVYLSGSQELSFDLAQTENSLNGAKMVSDDNIEPGWSSAKLIKLSNEGTLDAKIKLNCKVTGTLSEVLWFDFITVTESSGTYTIAGTFIPKAMTNLTTVISAIDYSLAADNDAYVLFVYGMYTDAGNTYQGEEIDIEVSVLATQAASEADGFGNTDYDAESLYYDENSSLYYNADGDVVASTANEVVAAVAAGENVVLSDDVELTSTEYSNLGNSSTPALNITSGELEVDLNGNTLSLSGSSLELTNAVNTTVADFAGLTQAEIYALTGLNVDYDTLVSYFGEDYIFSTTNEPVNVTITNGTITSDNRTMMSFESGSTATFENVEFECTGSGTSQIKVSPGDGSLVNTYTFKNCAFTNTYLNIAGKSNKGNTYECDITIEDCSFNETLGNGVACIILDNYCYGTVNVSGCEFNATVGNAGACIYLGSYYYGTVNVSDCTFDITATGTTPAAVYITTYPSYIDSNTVTLNLENISFVGTSYTAYGETNTPKPVITSNYDLDNSKFTVNESGTNSYTTDQGTVNYLGETI